MPVMVERCKPPGLLGQLVYVDITMLPASEARRALLRSVRHHRPKPKRRPRFPGRSRSASSKTPGFPPDISCAGPFIPEHVGQWANSPAMHQEVGASFLRNELDTEIVSHGHCPSWSLLAIDIDGLTQINKQFGTNVGNHVLAAVCALVANTKAIRLSGRCGHDTFYAVLPGLALEEAREVAEELRRTVEGYAWTRFASSLRVTCSIGVAQLAKGEVAADCVARAADGFKRAKASGGNRVEYGPYLSSPGVGRTWPFS